jgi:hypothetical protein
VNADSILRHTKQRPSKGRIQRVADGEEQRAELTARVSGRKLFLQIARDDRYEIGGLLALDIDDSQTLAGLYFKGSAVSRLDDERVCLICHVVRLTAPG